MHFFTAIFISFNKKPLRLLSGHILGKSCSFGLLHKSCSLGLLHVLIVLCLFVILVISCFCFEVRILILIAPVPGHCLLFTCSNFI